ncbi:hypothetical protein [Brevibacillus borstelensis]|uniref:hypothetical protein n=1 Tax=Brevibacillus borstelensis TaxID=45462 RepID=UPI0004F34187|nr:hypothetical protein [Brevibacillus borstelensis]KKX56524.1 hypothetical protein X546_03765 [Brevibacillus borstelensis cifa_chp40]
MTKQWKQAWQAALLALVFFFSPAQHSTASAESLDYSSSVQNGKLVVSASLKNPGDGRSIGVIAVGYDANGKAIETKGADVFIPRGQTGKYQIVMDRGAQIAKVEVIPADLSNPTGKLSSSAYSLVNGKMVVTAVVENGGDGRNIGVIAIGYDANGKAIETKGLDTFIPRNEVGSYQILLDQGAKIANVNVLLADLSNPTGKLSSEAFLQVNGKTLVTAVVENGGDGRNIGVFAVGNDAKGKAVETKGQDSFIPRNEVGSYQIMLDHGAAISGVKVYLADLSNPTGKLSSSAYTQVNGKMVVTAVVENGGDGRSIGVFAVGYDAKGKPVETAGQDTFIPRNEVGNYNIVLNQGAKIASAKVFLADLSNPAAKLSSSAFTPVNGTMLVTAVAENGGDGKNIGVTAVGYDAKGKAIASKSAKTFIPRNEVGNYQLSLPNAGKIVNVKVTLTTP